MRHQARKRALTSSGRARNARHRRCPWVEGLENRSLLATILVDTFTDEVNPGDGRTSLREAIAAAADYHTHPGPDEVVLPAGFYDLSQNSLSIHDDVTLRSSDGIAILDGTVVVEKIDGFFYPDATIDNITIRHGPEADGIVLQGGYLTLTGCTIYGRGGGVGISGWGESLRISDCTIVGNGCGIKFRGEDLRVTHSQVSYNSGCGIESTAESLRVTDCVIRGIAAEENGAASPPRLARPS